MQGVFRMGFGFCGIARILLLGYGMRLLMCAALAAISIPLSARSEVLGEIPFQYREGLIWLKVAVSGENRALNFLLDTGSGVSVLDLQIARALGVKLSNRQSVQGVNGPASAYRVNDLEATSGCIVLPKSVMAIDLRTLSNCCQNPVDGILGADFFRGRVVQIDFAAAKVRLLANCNPSLAKCETLPIKICNDAFCVPVGVAGNHPRWMRLDTGCDTALEFVVSGVERERVALSSIGLSGGSNCSVQTEVQLGTMSIAGVSAGIHNRQLFPNEAGLLGNGVLSNFRLTVDEPRSRVIFEKVQRKIRRNPS
jgi:hypothetical protein